MDHRKKKKTMERRKGKINRVINILNCSPGHPPQGASSLLVGMGGRIGHFLLEMASGLSSPTMGRSKSLDKGSSDEMDEAPEAR